MNSNREVQPACHFPLFQWHPLLRSSPKEHNYIQRQIQIIFHFSFFPLFSHCFFISFPKHADVIGSHQAIFQLFVFWPYHIIRCTFISLSQFFRCSHDAPLFVTSENFRTRLKLERQIKPPCTFFSVSHLVNKENALLKLDAYVIFLKIGQKCNHTIGMLLIRNKLIN